MASDQDHACATSQSGRILSVNVGMPQPVRTRSGTVLTSIFKTPVQSRVSVRHHNIQGDRQADLRVHGGPYKAIYSYSSEHYPFWKKQLPDMDLPFGMFCENLTTEGITEETVCIGDQFLMGSAVLLVTQPRMPCFKLGIRFGRADMVKLFWKSGLSGIYFSIVAEGDLAAGDAMERIARPHDAISVAEVVRLYRGDETSEAVLERALQAPLFGSWKAELRERQSLFR